MQEELSHQVRQLQLNSKARMIKNTPQNKNKKWGVLIKSNLAKIILSILCLWGCVAGCIDIHEPTNYLNHYDEWEPKQFTSLQADLDHQFQKNIQKETKKSTLRCA